MAKRPLQNADDRPRIYLSPCTPAPYASWRLAPGAVPRLGDTPGAALDAALAYVGPGPAVIIWEGRNG